MKPTSAAAGIEPIPAKPAAMQAKNVNTMRHHVIAGAARSEL
jgi:hypothetical protein